MNPDRGENKHKRVAEEDDVSTASAGQHEPKKRRQSSKRVSFGGEHIKLFDSNAGFDSDFLAISPEKFPRRNASPHPKARRGLAFDDENTIDNSNRMLADNTSLHSDAPSQAPRASGNFDFDWGEDNKSKDPRFSVMLGDETGFPDRPSLGQALPHAEDDISLNSLTGDLADVTRSMTVHGSPSFGPSNDHVHMADMDVPGHGSSLDDASFNAPEGNGGRDRIHRRSVQKPASEPRSAPLDGKRVNRQSLPENRQLFSNENDDEDVTLHFNEPASKGKTPPTSILKKPSRTFSEPGVKSLQSPLGRLSDTKNRQGVSTPQSVLGTKIRAAALEMSAGKPTIEHSISEETGTVTTPSRAPQFRRVNKFLDAAGVGLHFDYLNIAATPQKILEGIDNLDLNTLEGKLAACVTKSAVVDELENTRVELQRKITSVRNELNTISASIEQSPPEIVLKVTDDANVSPDAKNVMQSGLKRLRRKATMKAGLDWVKNRIVRESRIADLLDSSNNLFLKDTETMVKRTKALRVHNETLEKTLNMISDTGIPADIDVLSEHMNSQLAENLGEAVSNVHASRRKLQECKSKIEVLSEKEGLLSKEVRELEKKCNEAQRYIECGSTSMLEDAIAKLRLKYCISSNVFSIEVLNSSDRRLELDLGGLANVVVDLDNDVVTAFEMKPCVKRGNGLPDAMYDFCTDVVTRCCKSIRNVQSMKEIPLLFHLLKSYFTMARETCLDAAEYLDRRGLEFLKTPYITDSESSDLVLSVGYFHVLKRQKFTIIFTIRHYPPQFDGAMMIAKAGSMNTHVSNIIEVIGKAPSIEIVCQHMEKCQGVLKKIDSMWQVFK